MKCSGKVTDTERKVHALTRLEMRGVIIRLRELLEPGMLCKFKGQTSLLAVSYYDKICFSYHTALPAGNNCYSTTEKLKR